MINDHLDIYWIHYTLPLRLRFSSTYDTLPF